MEKREDLAQIIDIRPLLENAQEGSDNSVVSNRLNELIQSKTKESLTDTIRRIGGEAIRWTAEKGSGIYKHVVSLDAPVYIWEEQHVDELAKKRQEKRPLNTKTTS